MRWILGAILVLSLFPVLVSCGGGKDRERDLIVVSVYPYELLLKQIVGPDIEVRSLIPANASPHTFSPRPRELQALREAKLALANGWGLEANLGQAFTSAGDKLLRVDSLLVLPSEDAALGVNPHVWLSPALMRQLAIKLRKPLQAAFPDKQDLIANNCGDLVSQLSALDSLIRREAGTFAGTPLLTWHDSFHHFIRDYGLDYVGSVESSPGREPTPRELSDLGGLIRARGVKAVCVEPQFDRRSATALADEFGLRIVELDPLGHSFKPQTLGNLIRGNWERMKLGWQ